MITFHTKEKVLKSRHSYNILHYSQNDNREQKGKVFFEKIIFLFFIDFQLLRFQPSLEIFPERNFSRSCSAGYLPYLDVEKSS